jgi:hypothetical protein
MRSICNVQASIGIDLPAKVGPATTRSVLIFDAMSSWRSGWPRMMPLSLAVWVPAELPRWIMKPLRPRKRSG